MVHNTYKLVSDFANKFATDGVSLDSDKIYRHMIELIVFEKAMFLKFPSLFR